MEAPILDYSKFQQILTHATLSKEDISELFQLLIQASFTNKELQKQIGEYIFKKVSERKHSIDGNSVNYSMIAQQILGMDETGPFFSMCAAGENRSKQLAGALGAIYGDLNLNLYRGRAYGPADQINTILRDANSRRVVFCIFYDDRDQEPFQFFFEILSALIERYNAGEVNLADDILKIIRDGDLSSLNADLIIIKKAN